MWMLTVPGSGDGRAWASCAAAAAQQTHMHADERSMHQRLCWCARSGATPETVSAARVPSPMHAMGKHQT
eukprot:807487-Alexandrium_andersonii.AAC.1